MPLDLNNADPINTEDPAHAGWLDTVQGNILSGHGRDHTVHLFLRFTGHKDSSRLLVRDLTDRYVTSALKQETERRHYRDHKIPGGLFGAFFLSNRGYVALGFSQQDLDKRFDEKGNQPRHTASHFLAGMAANAVDDLGDPDPGAWDPGYGDDRIDAMLLMADDDQSFLLRKAREAIDVVAALAEVVCVEHGHALRTDSGEGIEHFGYVDGRSQPLFLAADFKNLHSGAIGAGTLESESNGKVDVWNPREPLKLVLIPDPMVDDAEDCFGSYFVFRKLEQNVRGFTVAEQVLADELGLKEEDRERAGAMAVGRFRDGTPLVLSQTDGLVPAKENNFRYDVSDPQGNKCPFHAHIRKTNPRGDITVAFPGASESAERDHRVARRGITYGDRNRHPNAFQAIDDLPSKDVGLLFMCYQASIRNQFAFMQRGWANNQGFIPKPQLTGLDPIIGQLDRDTLADPVNTRVPLQWKTEYDKPQPVKAADFSLFVKMRGGEFFFAPSLKFLRSLDVTGA